MARDLMGNESEAEDRQVFLIESSPSWLGGGAKASGALSSAFDIDAFRLGLLEGDALSVKLQTVSAGKSEALLLNVDLVSPAGERFLVGGYPEDSPGVGIQGWEVPTSGRYLIVLRADHGGAVESGAYKLKVKVRQSKTNKKGKGGFTGTEIPFDAVAGSRFKASLKGEGVDVDGVSLVGPDGPVAIEVSGKPGKVKIQGVVLTAGTGGYRIRFGSSVTVAAKWSVKLPKIRGTVLE